MIVYDVQNFDKKPSPANMGMAPAILLGEYYLCNSPDRGFVEAWVLQQAQSAAAQNCPILLDVESRALDIQASSKSRVWANVQELLYLITLIKSVAPNAKVGSTVGAPIIPLRPLDCDAATYARAQAASDFLRPLTSALDFFSTMATYLNLGEGEAQFLPRLQMFLSECDRLDPAHGKPRLPTLFPRFNAPTLAQITPITDAGMWWEMLRALKQYKCDGWFQFDSQSYTTPPATIDQSPCFQTTVNFAQKEAA